MNPMSASMSRFGKTIEKQLQQYGFLRIGRANVFAVRHVDIAHVVVLTKSRVDDSVGVYCGAWHPDIRTGLVDRFSDELSIVAVGGRLSPSGLRSDWWWHFGEANFHQVFDSLSSLGLRTLATIATREDLRQCLGESAITDTVRAQLEGQLGGESDTSAWSGFELQGAIYPSELFGAKRMVESEFRGYAKRFLAPMLADMGFLLTETDRQLLFLRTRGTLVDVVEPLRQLYGVHGVLNCFIWDSRLWKVRKELKNLYIPTNGGCLGESSFDEGVTAIEWAALETPSVIADVHQRFRAQALPYFDGAKEPDDFLRLMDPNYLGTFGASLGRLG